MGKKDTSGGGTVRTRKDGLKEARLLVPKEYRAGVGRIYLYFYGMTEREAKDERSATLSDLIQRGPRLFDARRITFGEWLERWIDSLPGTVAVNTQVFYEHRARTYPKPVLGASSSPSSPPSTSTAFTGISREARARLRAGRSRLRPLVFRPLRRHPRRALE